MRWRPNGKLPSMATTLQSILVLCLLSGACVGCKARAKVDAVSLSPPTGPDFEHPWRGCGVGSWVEVRGRTRTVDGRVTEVVAVQKLLQPLDQGGRVETRQGGIVSTRDEGLVRRPVEVRVGEETLRLDGRDVPCEIFERFVEAPQPDDSRVGDPPHRRWLGTTERVWRSRLSRSQGALVRIDTFERYDGLDGGIQREPPPARLDAVRIDSIGAGPERRECTVLLSHSVREGGGREDRETWDCPGIPGGWGRKSTVYHVPATLNKIVEDESDVVAFELKK